MRDFRGDFCFPTLVIIHTEKRRVQIKRHNLIEREIPSELLESTRLCTTMYICGYTSSFGKSQFPMSVIPFHKGMSTRSKATK